ncbi:hypothetical protein Droror1_Dr00024969 [Drosera rotundifolia]
MTLITEEIRAKATIYHGEEACQEKKQFLLKQVGLPEGLLPLQDVEECGYIEETGFVWLKQKKKTDHKFEKINKLVSYATEVTAYAESCKIRNLTGVKAKELLFWVTISEITIPSPNGDKVTFKSSAGPSRTFPAAAFVLEKGKEVKNEKIGAGLLDGKEAKAGVVEGAGGALPEVVEVKEV